MQRPDPTGPQAIPPQTKSEKSGGEGSRYTPLWMMLFAILMVLVALYLLLSRPVRSYMASLEPTPTRTPIPTETPTVMPSATPAPTLTPTQRPTAGPRPAFVASEDLRAANFMDDSHGWGVGEGALWYTQDGGQSWQDVTPGSVPGDTVGGAGFFLDAQVGWYFVARDQADYTGTLYRTLDGGQTWVSSSTPFAGYYPSLFFLDQNRGWVITTGDHFARDLYVTENGGASWQVIHRVMTGANVSGSLPDSGALFGPVFRDDLHGWMSGEVLSANGPTPFYESEDGGRTWVRKTLPMEAGYVAQSVSRPRFFGEDLLDGVVSVQAAPVTAPNEFRWYVYRTQDGGRSWQPATPVDALNVDSYFTLASLQDFFVFFNDQITFSHDGGQTWQVEQTNFETLKTVSGVQADITGLDFVDGQVGWAWAVDEGRFHLYQTQDGGAQWQEVTIAGGAGANACRMQWVALGRELPAVEEAGPYQGWRSYVPGGYPFTFNVPPDWELREGFRTCPDQTAALRGVWLSPPGKAQAEMTILFRWASEDSLPYGWPETGDLEQRGSVTFFGREISRDVWTFQGNEKAVLYAGGNEIEGEEQTWFSIRLYGKDPQNDFGPIKLDPGIQEQADLIVESFGQMQATSDVLEKLNVGVEVSVSPDGRWQAEGLMAYPIQGESPVELSYNRLQLLVPGSSAPPRTVFEQWGIEALYWLAAENGAGSFTWSPDGRWLYAAPLRRGDNSYFVRYDALYRVDLQSGLVEEVRLFESQFLVNLGVAPDAKRMAYLSTRREQNPRIIIHDLETDLEQAIALPVDNVTSWSAGQMMWSPDSQRLAFLLFDEAEDYVPMPRISVMLVEPAQKTVRMVYEGLDGLWLDGWHSDRALRLVDNRSLARFSVDVFSGEQTELPADPFTEPRDALARFLNPLMFAPTEPGVYETVVEQYGGDWDELIRMNPGANPQDRADLMRRACENNGYYCLRLRRIVAQEQLDADRFLFAVELMNRDGSAFALRGEMVFQFVVQRGEDGRFRVMSLPPK